MSEITLQEMYETFVGTLRWCSSNVRSLSDEELLCYLFEEFDVEARSFLHENSLDKFREAGLIDDEDVEVSKEIRRRWLALESQKWTPEQIRCETVWDNLFKLCDSLRLKVTSRNSRLK
jgi:hypothetical protein